MIVLSLVRRRARIRRNKGATTDVREAQRSHSQLARDAEQCKTDTDHEFAQIALQPSNCQTKSYTGGQKAFEYITSSESNSSYRFLSPSESSPFPIANVFTTLEWSNASYIRLVNLLDTYFEVVPLLSPQSRNQWILVVDQGPKLSWSPASPR